MDLDEWCVWLSALWCCWAALCMSLRFWRPLATISFLSCSSLIFFCMCAWSAETISSLVVWFRQKLRSLWSFQMRTRPLSSCIVMGAVSGSRRGGKRP